MTKKFNLSTIIIDFIVIPLLFIYSSYIFRTSFLFISSVITDDYEMFSQYIGLVLFCLIEAYSFIVFIWHTQFKPFKQKALVINSAVSAVLNLAFLIMYFVNVGFYSSNYQNGLHSYQFAIFYPLLSFILLFASVVGIYFGLKDYDKTVLNNYRLLEKMSYYKIPFAILLMFLSFFMLYSFVLDFSITRNAGKYPFGYFALFMTLLACSIDVFLFLYDGKHKIIVNSASLGLNAISFILFISAISVFPNMMTYLAKPFGMLDFAGSFKILNILFYVTFGFMSAYNIVMLVLTLVNKRKEKRECVKE